MTPPPGFADAPVAVLATVRPDGAPHVVPVVFAVTVGPAVDTVYTAVDGKPKTTARLTRLANIEADARVSLLVEHYEDDWSRLWWVRADGDAVVHHDGPVADAGYDALRAKYPQYERISLDGPVIAVTVTSWSSWHA